MNPDDVADYLQHHPNFFQQHAELFATLTVPHPHNGRAISLAERQMMALRDKNKALELKLAELLRYGRENDAIAEKLHRWTRSLLLQRDLRRLPEVLCAALDENFALPHIALRVWDAADIYADIGCARPVAVDLISLANDLSKPVCGVPTEGTASANALLLENEPGDISDGSPVIHSMALLPLRRGAAPEAFGIMILGSSDPRRFHAGMETDFLERIAEIASAALTRILG